MKKTLLALSALSVLALAEETPLKTHGELGYVQTKGNTDTQAFNLSLDLKKEGSIDIFTVDLDGQYATDSGVETKNKYSAEATYGYKLTERLALDYLIGYKSDKFSGFKYQFYTGPGLKYKAIDMQEHKLLIEGNILYALDQYDDVWTNALNENVSYPYKPGDKVNLITPAYKDDYAAYRLKGVYDWQILENLKFQQELSYRGSFEDSKKYFAYSKTSLTNKISDIFSAGVSYAVDYVNIPAEDKKKTDTTLSFNLIMDY